MIPGSVTVGFIHPGHYAACFAESLIELLLHDLMGAHRIFGHELAKLAKECGSGGIVAGRNALAKAMVDESPAEWLFMVDSDMGFAPDTVERLLAAADPVVRPVVGALCFAHKADGRKEHFGVRYKAQPTLYRYVETPERVGVTPMFEFERDALVRVEATGAACVLVHRSVLEKMRERFGDVWFDPATVRGTTFSEDLSFCLRLLLMGVPLHVHTGVTTTHHKGGVYLDLEFFDRQQAAREAVSA